MHSVYPLLSTEDINGVIPFYVQNSPGSRAESMHDYTILGHMVPTLVARVAGHIDRNRDI